MRLPLQISDVLAMLSAAGSVTVEPTARAVPLSVSLQATLATPLASIVDRDTVTLSLRRRIGLQPPPSRR